MSCSTCTRTIRKNLGVYHAATSNVYQPRENYRDTVYRFHKNFGFPGQVLRELPKHPFRVTPTHHARIQSIEDRLLKEGEQIPLPTGLNPAGLEIIEVDVDKKSLKVVKILYRASWKDDRDIVLAIIPPPYEGSPHPGRIKTVWINRKDDKHHTLQASKYDNVNIFSRA